MIEKREVGRAKMYKSNVKHPVIKKFIELDNAIFDFYASQLQLELRTISAGIAQIGK